MKKLNMDYSRHMGYSRTAEKGIRPHTVFNEDDRRDNWYVSADGETLKKYPPVQKESGLLVSVDWRA